jgi:serine protease Do
MTHRFLLGMLVLLLVISAPAAQRATDGTGESWIFGSDESGGGSSYLGVDIADVTTERLSDLKLKEEHGAEVTMVDQDAPAGKAGLHEHDVILSMNGTEVESAAQLRRMIKETPAGRVVTLGISRDGQPMTIKVQLADRKKSMTWPNDMHEYKFEMPEIRIPDIDIPVSVVIAHSSMRSGLMVENITAQLGEFFGVKGGKGVLVRSVEKGSRGEKAGFHAGDVIVKVNDQLVRDASDFTHALRESKGGTATVTFVRDKHEQTLTLTLPSRRDSGKLLENAFDVDGLTAQLRKAENTLPRISAEAIQKSLEDAECAQEAAQEAAREAQDAMGDQMEDQQQELKQQFEEQQQKLRDQQKLLEERQQKLQHELSGEWTEI